MSTDEPQANIDLRNLLKDLEELDYAGHALYRTRERVLEKGWRLVPLSTEAEIQHDETT